MNLVTIPCQMLRPIIKALNFQSKLYPLLWLALLLAACNTSSSLPSLHPISVAEFSEFVKATNYVTDAEKYGWSVVQQDVFKFKIEYGVDWRCPDGRVKAPPEYPVTQVSFKDAIAYCAWSNTRLPSYEEFWQITTTDKRPVVSSAPEILPLGAVNLVGNVWDITTSERSDGQIRLAGGSYLCNENTCNGTSQERVLFVDKETGNTHISFSVIRE